MPAFLAHVTGNSAGELEVAAKQRTLALGVFPAATSLSDIAIDDGYTISPTVTSTTQRLQAKIAVSPIPGLTPATVRALPPRRVNPRASTHTPDVTDSNYRLAIRDAVLPKSVQRCCTTPLIDLDYETFRPDDDLNGAQHRVSIFCVNCDTTILTLTYAAIGE